MLRDGSALEVSDFPAAKYVAAVLSGKAAWQAHSASFKVHCDLFGKLVGGYAWLVRGSEAKLCEVSSRLYQPCGFGDKSEIVHSPW